jgi:hypothetical protein
MSSGREVSLQNAFQIGDCKTVSEVRAWLNDARKFVNFGDHLINTDNIDSVYVIIEGENND